LLILPAHPCAEGTSGLIRGSYSNALRLVLANHCQSVALPAISCGVYGYPISDAAAIALAVAGRPDFAALDMQFYLFDRQTYDLWQQQL